MNITAWCCLHGCLMSCCCLYLGDPGRVVVLQAGLLHVPAETCMQATPAV